jgi:hypothetical protein
MRFLVGALAPLFAASIAHAQAPGEAEPVVIAPIAGPCACGAPVGEAVMQNRWAVGFSIGSASFAPQSSPDDKTQFDIGEIAIRWRAIEQMEVELSLGGGTEKLADGTQGTRQLSSVVIGARYRFRPERAWNWFLMGGVGAMSVTPQNATDQQKNDASHPQLQFGIGIERRFRHFALQAELRLTAVSDKTTNQDDNSKSPPMATPVTGTTGNTPTSTMAPPASTAEKQSGGQATIGVSYYF